ncbi:amyloid protein-binding protein 2-like isoform X3 [Ctenocephalides felis]|uniref:amyloid protein-binding protein 2-like isoform X3 n=1 Tax=Ctenocephalides felis TaxID=7515 RepID=UPI000E6E10E0|nr:amyloid protein-binding protein 2-like isoform X3 [Ctenocephalides felis]
MVDVQSSNMPKSLYLLSIACVGSNLHKRPTDKNVLRTLPDNVLMDIYYTMLQEEEICNLSMELGDLEIFARLLRELSARIKLLKCFQAVMDHKSNSARDLSDQMAEKCSETDPQDEKKAVETIQLGLRLGGFLSDAGWFTHSERVLLCVRTLCHDCKRTERMMHLTLQCYQRLLHTQSIFYRLEAALETAKMSTELVEQVLHGQSSCSKPEQDDPGESTSSEILLNCQSSISSDSEDNFSEAGPSECSSCETKNLAISSESTAASSERSYFFNPDIFVKSNYSLCNQAPNDGLGRHLAALYAELSRLWFNRSDYDASYQYSVKALKYLRGDAPAKVKIDVLRQAAKSCVVKRDFARAGLLIRLAVYLARETFGLKHPKYSDALIDYGFYLLNVDSIAHSVKIYKDALDIKYAIFGVYNLHVAIAHEDLAYALYVHEYSSGRFYKARENAEKAIEIMQRLVPSNHLMLASAKRVKALILEEIALDNIGEAENELLYESEKLHLTALELSTMAFGERNVQTAKHYGNLGRLYQSMKKFKEAESMHLKAIAIKEQLLGSDDYEVGLSVGHLASLYNYHMLQYREAETLYHRSIAISLKLFGETYSGLEYDYRGLVHVYHELNDNDKMWQYEETLSRWRQLRRDQVPNQVEIDIQEPISIEDVTRRFFAMCKHK